MSETNEKASYLWRLGRWMAELVLVFVGVYAAFWLNNYQQHLQEAKRRDQILASIEQTLRDGIESGNLTGHKKNDKPRNFSKRSTPARCPGCIRLFSRPTTLRSTSPPCFNPAASSSSMSRRSPRCATTNRLSAGAEPHGALSETQRRANRTESRRRHFLLLRSGRREIAKTLPDVSRSSPDNGEICSRPRKNPHRAAQTNSGRAATPLR